MIIINAETTSAETSTQLTCSDTDDLNIFTHGRVTGTNLNGFYSYSDVCTNSRSVKEWVCNGLKPESISKNCPSGYKCSGGACIPQKTTTTSTTITTSTTLPYVLPSIKDCAANVSEVYRGGYIRLTQNISQGTYSIKNVLFELNSTANYSYSDYLDDTIWVDLNTSNLSGNYSLRCFTIDSSKNSVHLDDGSFSVKDLTSTTSTTSTTTTTAPSAVRVTRHLPATAQQGSSFTVTLSMEVNGPAPPAVGITEYFPAGWTVSDPTFNAVYQGDRFEWLFWSGGMPVEDRNITYIVTVPLNALAVSSFSGTVDTGTAVDIGGDASIFITGGETTTTTTTSVTTTTLQCPLYVVRSLPERYSPGLSFNVTLAVDVDVNEWVYVYGISERVPEGWNVSSVSSGGIFNSQQQNSSVRLTDLIDLINMWQRGGGNISLGEVFEAKNSWANGGVPRGTIEWLFWYDDNREMMGDANLSYVVTVPADDAGVKNFSGFVDCGKSINPPIFGDTTMHDNTLSITRYLPPAVAPGSSFTVTLSMFVPEPRPPAAGIIEYYPAGWTVSDISYSGIVNSKPVDDTVKIIDVVGSVNQWEAGNVTLGKVIENINSWSQESRSKIEWLFWPGGTPVKARNITYRVAVPMDISNDLIFAGNYTTGDGFKPIEGDITTFVE